MHRDTVRITYFYPYPMYEVSTPCMRSDSIDGSALIMIGEPIASLHYFEKEIIKALSPPRLEHGTF